MRALTSRSQPAGAAAPVRVRPCRVAGTGRIVFLAGQTAQDANGRIVADGVVAQFERALGNLLTALRAAGGGPEHLAALTIYLVDVDDYRAHAAEIGGVWRRWSAPTTRPWPASASPGSGTPRRWSSCRASRLLVSPADGG